MKGSQYWKCPKCGAILDKRPAYKTKPAIGTITCGGCGAPFDVRDVYRGVYDVAVEEGGRPLWERLFPPQVREEDVGSFPAEIARLERVQLIRLIRGVIILFACVLCAGLVIYSRCMAPTPAQVTPTATPSPVTTPTVVPSPTPTLAGTTYTVQAGDTLITIAAKFGVNWKAIAEANDIEDPGLIREGQVLFIPLPK